MKSHLPVQIRNCINNIPEEEYASNKRLHTIKADLSLNINPCGVSKNVTAALLNANSSLLSHYYFENDDLIEEIAGYMGVKPENILLGDGCDGCLGMIANTFIELADTAVIPTPTFHRYEFHTLLMGGSVVFVPMRNFVFDISSILSAAIDSNAKIIFLCNPNNPTGVQIPTSQKIELLKNFSGIVVVDEALADTTTINGAQLIRDYPNLVITRSFSKTFGLAGLRIGYVVANAELIRLIKKTSSPFKVNSIAQELALEALKDVDHLVKSKSFVDEERSRMVLELRAMGLFCSNSVTTNFVVDISPLGSVGDVIGLLHKKNILVTDASHFRMDKNIYLRIAVGSKEENRYFINSMKELFDA